MTRIYLKFTGRNTSADAIIRPKILKCVENLYFEDSKQLNSLKDQVFQQFRPGIELQLLMMAKSLGISGPAFKRFTNKLFRRN